MTSRELSQTTGSSVLAAMAAALLVSGCDAASPANEQVFQTRLHGQIVKFCDGGRAVYSNSRGVAVVENAPECAPNSEDRGND